MKMKRKDIRTYRKAYKAAVDNQTPITGRKYDKEVVETIKNIGDYRPCYERGNKAREQLPKYWFVSKEGFVISFHNTKKPVFITPYLQSYRPEFNTIKRGKKITSYSLVALVWGSFRSESAQRLLDTYGIKALGKYKKIKGRNEPKVHAHHIKPYIHSHSLESYIQNNNPDNLQLITNRQHREIHKILDNQDISYMPEFINVPQDEIEIYDIDNGKMLKWDEVEPKYLIHAWYTPREQDCCQLKDYILLSENNHDFLQANDEKIERILSNVTVDEGVICIQDKEVYFKRKK